jgi:putative peptidoglycan lipid II flippase
MRLNHILNSQTKTITFGAILLGISYAISGVLGLIRDRLLAGRFGAGKELDIYFAAFRIPDLVYGILIAGGVVAAFLPLFSEYFHRDPKEAWKLTNNVLNCFLILLIFICGILFIFAPLVINLVAPGFEPAQKILTANLARIIFLSPIFFGLSSVFSGILQYFNRFLIYSLAPVFYNLGIIFGILFLVPKFGLYGLAYGVIFGAFLYFIIQIPAAFGSGYKYRPICDLKSSGLRKIFKLMIPRIIGQASYHLNLIVITAIASTLISGSIAIFNFSNNLQSFPIGIIGISFAVAAFPDFSRVWIRRQKEKFLENFSSVFRQIIFLIVPVSFLMFILRAQLVRLILGIGRFGWWETQMTAASLGIFSFGIVAAALIPLLARAFFSFQDTKTPVAIGIISMLANIVLSLLFVALLKEPTIFQKFMTGLLKLQGIERIEIIGLALALSLSGIFQCLLLLFFLRKKIGDFRQGEIWQSFKRVFAASAFMLFLVYLSLQAVALFVNLQTFSEVFLQTAISGGAGIIFFALISFALKFPELETIKSSIIKQLGKR